MIISREAEKAIDTIKGILAVASSNFPAETNIRVEAIGANHASATIPYYVLWEIIIKAALKAEEKP
jgi:hypothetical protein